MKQLLRLFIVLLFLCCLAACSSGDGKGLNSASGDDDSSPTDDDNDDNDNDDNDNDDSGSDPEDPSPSFNYGIVHYHYYGDLGGTDGQIFRDDQKWAAETVDLGIIGDSDDGSRAAWNRIRINDPRGRWLKWQTAHLFNTFEAAGTCENPERGEADQNYSAQLMELFQFTSTHMQYENGESCFLHARHAGRIQARWHAMGCDVVLDQIGMTPGTGPTEESRLQTLVWDEYTRLYDISSDCFRDFTVWKIQEQILEDKFAGAGFDNLGSPLEDGFYLPVLIDPIDINEIPNDIEADPEKLDIWYYNNIRKLLAAVGAGIREVRPDATLVFNGATYCSWDGYTDLLTSLVSEGVGIWCESGLQYPAWGVIDTPDRLETLIDLSNRLAEKNSYLVLETAYDNGSEQADPSPPEVLFYLSAFYVLKNTDDVMTLVPDWSPYSPLKDVLWFPIFERDLGQPDGPAEILGDGIFTRPYRRNDGLETLIVVRVDGDNPAVSYTLDGDYCRADADNLLTPLSGNITLESGDGLILLKKGAGDVDC